VTTVKRKNAMSDALDKTAELFDLPEEVVRGAPRVTVTGCRRVFVENHRGLLEYGEKEIDVNGGRVILRVRGEGLRLCAMTGGELLITGEIAGLEFSR